MRISGTKWQRALWRGFDQESKTTSWAIKSKIFAVIKRNGLLPSSKHRTSLVHNFISRCSQRSFTKFQSPNKPQCAETRRTGTKTRTGKAYWRRGRYEPEPFSGRFGDPPRTLTRTPSSWPPVTARSPPTPSPPAFPSSWVISFFMCLTSTEFAVNQILFYLPFFFFFFVGVCSNLVLAIQRHNSKYESLYMMAG